MCKYTYRIVIYLFPVEKDKEYEYSRIHKFFEIDRTGGDTMGYRFSNSSRYIINENKVVLGNRYTGLWIRISKEVYDILELGINNDFSLNELKCCLYDEEDRNYIDSLYKKLCYMEIIEDRNPKKRLENKMASFEITHRCNLKCIHCCIDADSIVSDKKDLSTKKVQEVLNKLIEWGPARIMLSGGEPLVRKDFTKLLIYLRKSYKGKIVVSTNGTLINESNSEILSKCADQIDISLDGIDEKTCKVVRGTGIFDKVINSVKLLQNKGFKNITLSMVIGDKNQYLEGKFNELNKMLNTIPLIRVFSAVGRGLNNRSSFLNGGEDETYVPSNFLDDNYDKPFGMCNCGAGERELFITYNGDIYPCPEFMKSEYLLGNIFNINKISELSIFTNNNIKNYNLLYMLNYENYKECINCKVNLFCWTCPGQLEELKNNKLAIEDKCKKIKPVLYKRIWER
jgi:radical SAM protein with 4Fe4S-binding SPASM domain